MSIELLKKNALSDAEELARIIGRPFTVEEIADYTAKGIDLRLAAVAYTEGVTSDRDFWQSMKRKAASGRLTDNMVKAILNSMREKLLGIKKVPSATTPPEERVYNCFTCKKPVKGLAAIREHGRQHKAGEIDKEGNPLVEAPVIADRVSTLDLDLSDLPDGRYAAPDFSGKNDLIFLMVKRARKRYLRDRLFVYGKIRRGREWVEAGTIEVKEWSSDSKRLCGEQKAGEVYKGEFEKQIELILQAPEAWAKLFALHKGRCYRCGKTLTDEDSRAQGIGPECIKVDQWHHRGVGV